MAEYIDRAVLLKRIRGTGCHEQIKSNLEYIANMIPTADVRPVVRGHWIGIDEFPHDDWECDCCGMQLYGNDRIPREMSFCPNCGAVMIGEADG